MQYWAKTIREISMGALLSSGLAPMDPLKYKFDKKELALAALLGLVVCLLAHNAVLNHFYLNGAGSDSAWFSAMEWRTSWRLPIPNFLRGDNPSYFTNHISPIFWLPLLAGFLLPLDHISLYAWFIGSLYALNVVAFLLLCLKSLQAAGMAYARSLSCLLALLFATCGILVQQLVLPHFEMGMAAAILAFYLFYFLDKPVLAIGSLIFGFAVREDFGLHLASSLIFVMLWQWRLTRQPPRFLLYALLAAILTSFILLSVPSMLHEGQGLLGRTYMGGQAFARITPTLLENRFYFFFSEHNHLWVPMLMLVIAGIAARNPMLIWGGLFSLPWLLFNMIFSSHEAAGRMTLYYTFPLLVNLAWPMLCMLFQARMPPARQVRSSSAGTLVALQVVLLLATLMPASRQPFTQRFYYVDIWPDEDAAAAPHYALWRERFAKHQDQLGTFWTGYAVAAFAPQDIPRRTLYEAEYYGLAQPEAGNLQRDSILYFRSPYTCDWVTNLARHMQFRNSYSVRGTRLALLTNRTSAELDGFKDLLVPLHLKPGESLCQLPKRHS